MRNLVIRPAVEAPSQQGGAADGFKALESARATLLADVQRPLDTIASSSPWIVDFYLREQLIAVPAFAATLTGAMLGAASGVGDAVAGAAATGLFAWCGVWLTRARELGRHSRLRENARTTLGDSLRERERQSALTAPMIAGVAAAATELIARSRRSHRALTLNADLLSANDSESLQRLAARLTQLDPQTAARMLSWTKLERALRESSDVSAVISELRQCPVGDQQELASLLLTTLFDGEAPRRPMKFQDARKAYAELAQLAGRETSALPEPKSVDRTRPYKALGGLVWDLERALSSACAPSAKTLPGVGAQIERLRRGYGREAGMPPPGLGSVPCDAFRDELACCLDPDATPLERAATAIVAEQCLAILDKEFILGEQARAALRELIARGQDVPPSERLLAQQLYNVLDAFQGVGERRILHGVTESPSARAMRLLNDVPSGEARADLAAVMLERLFGGQPPEASSSQTLLETFIGLRAVAESNP